MPVDHSINNHYVENTDNLLLHIWEIHSEEKPFICKVCDRSFDHSSSLRSHLQSHADKDKDQDHVKSSDKNDQDHSEEFQDNDMDSSIDANNYLNWTSYIATILI